MLKKDDTTRTSTEIICPRIFVSFHLSQLLKLSRQRGEIWKIPGAGKAAAFPPPPAGAPQALRPGPGGPFEVGGWETPKPFQFILIVV